METFSALPALCAGNSYSRARAVPELSMGCFEQKSYVHSLLYEFCLPVQGQWSFHACIISSRAPDGLRDRKQSVNSPCGAPRGAYSHIQHSCGIFANSGCVNSLLCP